MRRLRLEPGAWPVLGIMAVLSTAALLYAWLWEPGPGLELMDAQELADDERDDEETLEQLRAVALLWRFAPDEILEASRLRELFRCRGGVAVFHGETLAQCWSRDEALELLEASERACREIEAPECWGLTFQLFDERSCPELPEPKLEVRDEGQLVLGIYRTQEAEDEIAFQRCQGWLEEDPEGRVEICRALRILAVGLRQ